MGQKDQFWPKTAKFGPKKIQFENFYRNFFSPFFKRPKNQFLWQKSGKFIEAFGRNEPKRAFLAKKGQILAKNGQKIEIENLTADFFSSFFKRPKNRFLWQKSGIFIVAFGRNGPKRAFSAQNGQILAKNGQKVENENFRQKSETSKSKFYGCQTSCKKPEKIIARFQLQNRNQRTHARTDGSEFIGSFRKLKLPGNQ